MRVFRSIVLTVLAGLCTTHAQSVLPGLLAQLESRNVTERSEALDQILKLPDATKDPVVREALLSRLDAENQLNRETLRESKGMTGGSEFQAEYVANLAGAVEKFVDWDDPRALRILAQSAYNADSPFARKLAAHAGRLVPVLVADAASDVPVIRSVTLTFIAEIFREYKPESLNPLQAAQLFEALTRAGSLQEADWQIRSAAAYLLRKIADVNRDGKVDCADVAMVRSAIGSKDQRADINLDRAVDGNDVDFVTARLGAGVRCPADR